MKYDKFTEVLFATKNNNKILTEFNKLSLYDKQVIIANGKIKKRLCKIADITLLTNILIDLPSDSRIQFLKSINYEKYKLDYEKEIIKFLSLANYEDFNYDNLSKFGIIKDKKTLSLILRKFSQDKLKSIILQNYDQTLNDYAFMEYSKKMSILNLEAIILNKISDEVLFTELKRRKAKEKNTDIDVMEFINLNDKKQNGILFNGNLEILESEIVRLYIEEKSVCENEQLIDRFEEILANFNYVKLIELQTIIYCVDEITAKSLMQLFFKEVLKFENNVEPKYLNSMIFTFRKLIEKTDEIFDVTKMKPFGVINYLNTGLLNKDIDKIFDRYINIEQYQKISIKKINRINRLLNKLYNNNDNISQETYVVILSYKLYLIFGYEISIELLSGKFGNIDCQTLGLLLNNCDVKNVDFKIVNNSYEPVLKKEFIQFFIGDKKDKNTTVMRVLRGELDIVKTEFSNLYNNFERFQGAIGSKIHLNKLLPLLQDNPFMLLPDEYKLTRDIVNNIIKSFKHNDVLGDNNLFGDDDKQFVVEACNFYHKYLAKRITSSIPRVLGKTGDHYSYEVLKLDDPIIMTLGYLTGCCFRLNGASKEFLQYCSESVYARVIVIKNEYGDICSMIPIIRNGNVIVGNSIESNSKADSVKTYNALKSAYKDILNISRANESQPIIACSVSNLHSNCYSNRRLKQIIYPIRSEHFYTNYGSGTYIVAMQENKSEQDFKLYVPDAIYYDERPEILIYRRGMNNGDDKAQVENRIKSIQYKLNRQNDNYFYFANYIICSEDWYLKVGYEGIQGNYIEKDPRALEEFNAVKRYLEEKFSNSRFYNIDLSDSCFDNIVSKKLVLHKKDKS